MTVPDSAIEAAAAGMEAARPFGVILGDVSVLARAALSAAEPALEQHYREAIAQEIEGDIVRMDDGRLNTFNMGAQHAARIARGGTP